ncbi:RodZ domain-containing protein [Marinobacter sp.]|uniref:RodZ domain-containing protein n=1 Tax=Marinobacter sp. TaxID=50741 RepID=UPI003A8D1ECF
MTSDDNQHSAGNESVGQQLKKAREKQGLSVSQIAEAQHLRNGVIQAIESGDYKQIDSELFLKGYIRTYAKQVGLNADSIIADLNIELEPARLQKARDLEANPLVNIERRRRRKRRIAKLLLLILVAAIIAAVVVRVVLPKLNSVDVAEEQSAITDPAPEIKAPEPLLEPEQSAGVSEATGYDSVDDAPELSSVVDVTADEQPMSDIEPAQPEADEQVPVVAENIEPVLAQPPVSEPAGPVSGVLEIEFTGDCWVQVRDASGNRLASSLQRAGDKLQVSGEAPLKVVIGAVDTVATISFQGEPVDIGGFPVVNNRSEFTLTI